MQYKDIVNKLSLNNILQKNNKSFSEKIFTYVTNLLHILGSFYLFFGMLITPYKYIHVYIFYLLTISIVQFILNDKSFMNDLIEDDDTIKPYNYKTLCLLLGISLVSLIIPSLYCQNMLKIIIETFNSSGILNYLPIILLYFWILLYLFVKLTKLKKMKN